MNDDIWSRALVEQNQRWLMVYFLAATGNYAESEDLVQETFTEALKNAGRFDKTKSFGAWLRGIARNVYLEHRRRSGRRQVPLSENALEHLDMATAAIEEVSTIPGYAEMRMNAFRTCLETLNERTEEVVRRRYLDGEPSKMIAAAMGMTVAAVDLVISRSRKSLSDCVKRKLRLVSHE